VTALLRALREWLERLEVVAMICGARNEAQRTRSVRPERSENGADDRCPVPQTRESVPRALASADRGTVSPAQPHEGLI
jgi:hypothetical protein